MAGYSGTPLLKKFGIKENYRIAAIGKDDATSEFEIALGRLPPVATFSTVVKGPNSFDVLVLFVDRSAGLTKRFLELAPALTPAGGLWVAWPKKSSGVVTDLTEDLIRELILPTGWVDNKVCAIDHTWSGLRFVLRLENRARK